MTAYLKALKEQLNALALRLSAQGIAREEMPAELVDDIRPSPSVEHGTPEHSVEHGVLEQSILDKLQGKPGGVSLKEIRASLGAEGKAKADFDRAVLFLYKEKRVYLDRHDHPLRLSDSERRDLVFDGAGTYYVGITLRGDFE